MPEPEQKKQYKDNVTVTGETFNGNKFKHELYFQDGASKEDVEGAVRVREVSAQKASLKIVQGETNEQAVAKQKKVDEALAKSLSYPPPVPAPGTRHPAPGTPPPTHDK